jgi:superfamily II DNA/RNA helicase
MNFDQFQLDPRLMQGVKKAGYDTATPIQEAAMPAALRGRDIIGTAQTGTGKTAAFVLPILTNCSQRSAQCRARPHRHTDARTRRTDQ